MQAFRHVQDLDLVWLCVVVGEMQVVRVEIRGDDVTNRM